MGLSSQIHLAIDAQVDLPPVRKFVADLRHSRSKVRFQVRAPDFGPTPADGATRFALYIGEDYFQLATCEISARRMCSLRRGIPKFVREMRAMLGTPMSLLVGVVEPNGAVLKFSFDNVDTDHLRQATKKMLAIVDSFVWMSPVDPSLCVEAAILQQFTRGWYVQQFDAASGNWIIPVMLAAPTFLRN